MSYKEFLQVIQDEVRKNMPASYKVMLSTVIKNNDSKLDALSILPTGVSVAPNIYLKQYYEEYQSGRELSSIVQLIIKLSKVSMEIEKEMLPDISDFNSIADLITYRLVNWHMNLEKIRKLPYKDLEDLVKIYYLVIKSDSNAIESIAITDALLEKWSVFTDKIDEHANRNTPTLFPASIRGMNEVIKELVFNGLPDADRESLSQGDYDELMEMFNTNNESDQMYILSNNNKINGASTLLYPKLLHDFAVSINMNFYILPSSIHECILVPDKGTMDKQALKDMVEEVNCSQVAADEVLSNEVYFYNRFNFSNKTLFLSFESFKILSKLKISTYIL